MAATDRLSPIDRIISRFPPDDARIMWWMGMKRHIQDRNYDLTITKLSYHNDDDDYAEQVEAIAAEIAWHIDQREAKRVFRRKCRQAIRNYRSGVFNKPQLRVHLIGMYQSYAGIPPRKYTV